METNNVFDDFDNVTQTIELSGSCKASLLSYVARCLGLQTDADMTDIIHNAISQADLDIILKDLNNDDFIEERLCAEAIMCLIDPKVSRLLDAFISGYLIGELHIAVEVGIVLHNEGQLDADNMLLLLKACIAIQNWTLSEQIIRRDSLSYSVMFKFLLATYLLERNPTNAIDELVAIFRYDIRNFVEVIRPVINTYLSHPHPDYDAMILRDAFPQIPDEKKIYVAWILLSLDRLRLLSDDQVRQIGGSSENQWLWVCQRNYEMTGDVNYIRTALNNLFIDSGLLPLKLFERPHGNFLGSLDSSEIEAQNDESGPLVSVIIASYNMADTIDYALQSIDRQTYSNLEIIIVDDASDDPVSLSDFPSAGRQISIVRNAANLGPYGSRNVGLAVAKGEFVAFHDADDWAHPQKIEHQMNCLLKTDAIAHYGQHIRVDPSGNLRLENNLSFRGDGPITGIYRRNIFDEIGRFLPVPSRGDIEFKRRIMAYYGAKRIVDEKKVLVIALDWHSNSKRTTDGFEKVQKQKRFLARSQKSRVILPFTFGAAPEEKMSPIIFVPSS